MKKLFLILLFTSCHNLDYDGQMIVERIELTKSSDFKYKVYYNAFPANQILFTNRKFNVGDTIKFCNQ